MSESFSWNRWNSGVAQANGEDIGCNFERAEIESIKRMVEAREEAAYWRGRQDERNVNFAQTQQNKV
jgi:hypothetical protein